MKILHRLTNPALDRLNEAYTRHDHKLWFVGGCVRDTLDNRDPKDIDLATDATPDEQIAIYEAEGIHFIPTGLHHGTITARVDGENYEITTLRTESNHDGRWADTTFTRSIEDDLGRRDLTINSMALSFDDELIDPYGGHRDLTERRIRFVGDANERMREDYLRILRWFRFHGRFACGTPLDQETCDAASAQAAGLEGISRERVWSEIKKIVAGPGADQMLYAMHRLGIARHIGLPSGMASLARARENTSDPITLLACYVEKTATFSNLAREWKMSSRERAQGRLICDRLSGDLSIPALKVRAAVHGEPIEWLAEAARVKGFTSIADKLMAWKIPEFPLTGNDFMNLGFVQGQLLGQTMAILRCEWGDSGFRISRDNLIKRASKALQEVS